MTLFKHVLECMIENNSMNDSNFNDWDNAIDAIELYESSFVGECDDEERDLTICCVDEIIEKNGRNVDFIIDKYNQCVWGMTFANNSQSVVFGG